jgi:peptidoglycan/xylan/chitin deacetylase (PgdA/CDA1 family)
MIRWPQMSSARRRLAHLLDGIGLPRAVLAARARELFPWRWLTVLTYHRISDTLAPGYDPEVVDAPAAAFESQVKLLQRYFTLIDTRDLDAWRAGGRLPPNPAMITFDDGYRDNHDVVLPILRRLGGKAVFFVATLYIAERRVFWWELVNHALSLTRRQQLRLRYPEPIELALATAADRRASVSRLLVILKREVGVDMDRFLGELYAASEVRMGREEERRLADELLMSWDHIRGLVDAGFDVQSHSHAHRVLHTLGPEEASADLRRSRQELESALDQPVSALAYPTGRPLGDAPALRKAVIDAGFRYGFTVDRLVPLAHLRDWLAIPRMMMDRAIGAASYRTSLALPVLAE